MNKITDNIYSFVLPLPFKSTPELTLYFIDGKIPTIIDSGPGDEKSTELIASKLKKIKRDIKDISLIINTHEHIEHYGGNRSLYEISNAEVLCFSKTAYKIENAQKINEKLKDYLFKFTPELAEKLKHEIDFDLKFRESRVDRTVNDREIIKAGDIELQAVSTPGHTAGHMCLYYADKKTLFTGDHILTHGSTFVGYDYREIVTENIVNVYNSNYSEPDNLSMYLDSLRECAKLDLEMLLSSHGGAIRNPYKKIDNEIRKKERRAKMFIDALEKNREISLTELTTEVYGRHFDDFLHKGSALGYLAYLNKDGSIKAEMRKDDLYLNI